MDLLGKYTQYFMYDVFINQQILNMCIFMWQYLPRGRCLVNVNYENDDYLSNAFNSSCIFNGVAAKAFYLKILVSNVVPVLSKCICLSDLKLVGKLSERPHWDQCSRR